MANVYLEQAGEFFRRFFRMGGTDAMLKKILADDALMERWIKNLTEQLESRFVHGRFTPLEEKIAMVKTWPGINPGDVDMALAMAMENGTVAGYEAEVGENPLLDIVITIYRESIQDTLAYARFHMCKAWKGKFTESFDVFAKNSVMAITDAKPFIPNRIVVEVIDFGANWYQQDRTHIRSVQEKQAPKLADFGIFYNAVESPKWVEQMDGEKVPYAIVAALLLNMHGSVLWCRSPSVWRYGTRVGLECNRIEDWICHAAMPVLRDYKR